LNGVRELLFEVFIAAGEIMKSVSCRTLVFVVLAFVLLACGKSLSESESAYAGACVKYMKGAESYRKICECSAPIIVPKLTKGELNAYVKSVDFIGKPMTEAITAPLGFTLAEFTSMGVKRQASFEEMRKQCGGEI
jgi:hypothetical protein